MQKKTSARRASICFLAFINERTVCEADSGVRSTGSRVNVTRELHREADSGVRSTGSRVNNFGNYLTERTAGTLWQQQQKNYFR